MTHHYNARDVEGAARRYVDLTGDKTAILEREGAYWTLRGLYFSGTWFGAREAWQTIQAFCHGWRAHEKQSEAPQ